jgi:hypothetical protein
MFLSYHIHVNFLCRRKSETEIVGLPSSSIMYPPRRSSTGILPWKTMDLCPTKTKLGSQREKNTLVGCHLLRICTISMCRYRHAQTPCQSLSIKISSWFQDCNCRCWSRRKSSPAGEPVHGHELLHFAKCLNSE